MVLASRVPYFRTFAMKNLGGSPGDAAFELAIF